MANERPPIDPFADDIVNDPRHVDYSVKGLNESVAEQIIAGVEVLQTSEKNASGSCSSKAMAVISPRAGFGKSHLIGSVFRKLSGRATLVNVRPFGDPATRWKSILDRVVQELDFPDRYAEVTDDRATQLELFAHGVLSRIVANDLEAGGGSQSVIEILRRPASKLTGLKSNKKWRQYIDKVLFDGRWLGTVESQVQAAGIRLSTPLPTWLRVLHSYAYDDDWERRRSCIDWIQADAVEDEIAGVIGIRQADRVSPEQTAGELNGLAKARVLDLCRLSRFFRPFLICFDQTETYGTSPDLARSLGAVVMDLVDEACNHLTVITANLSPWEKLLSSNWQAANLDRLAKPYLMLEGISQQQGRELAEHRLESFEVDRASRDRFWGDGRWLEELFGTSKEMSVRDLLHECSHRWAAGLTVSRAEPAPPERVPLATLFKKYCDSVSAKRRRLVFDRDTFHWLVRELAVGRGDLEIDTVTGSNGTGSPRWRHAGREFVFGFESGSHWKRWHKIARLATAKPDRVFVCFRTPELPSIPKPTWHVAKPDIDNARRSNLLILALSRHELVTLYAAHDLYADALQGDIDWSADDVAAFLREQLADFWRSILEWPGNPGPQPTSPSAEAGAEPPQPSRKGKRRSKPQSNGQAATDELSKRVVEVTQKRRFLSLDELMDSLPQEAERETVLGICGENPNIKVYTHPNMTMLQWQSS